MKRARRRDSNAPSGPPEYPTYLLSDILLGYYACAPADLPANTNVSAQGRSSPTLTNLGIILMTLSSVRVRLAQSPTPRLAAVSRRDPPAYPFDDDGRRALQTPTLV